ncbi:hypothetical protein XFEB_00782 [Xylella fastidiosa EB92.1]|nr:hypothetical protein XFEB_00782 [Xylella fastidiosa EB92.1]
MDPLNLHGKITYKQRLPAHYQIYRVQINEQENDLICKTRLTKESQLHAPSHIASLCPVSHLLTTIKMLYSKYVNGWNRFKEKPH